MENSIDFCFFGVYEKVFTNFIEYKKSLGFKYGNSRNYQLQRLNNFLVREYNPTEVCFTKEMVFDFLNLFSDTSPETFHNIECLLRQIGLYLKRLGYENVYIYPENKKKVTTTFTPYIYSAEEIHRIFDSINKLPEKTKFDNHHRLFYQTFIRLLYSTGMRISEATNLKVTDVNLENGVIVIHDGKEKVSRLVPVCSTMLHWLRKYYSETNFQHCSEYFFKPTCRSTAQRKPSTIDHYFKDCILPLANIKRKEDDSGPRVHDLRHTFACNALDKLIKEGKDPYCALPYLSFYLGHKGIESTEKYLRLTSEHFQELTTATHYIYVDSLGGDDSEG